MLFLWLILILMVKKWLSMYKRNLHGCIHISYIFATGKHVNHRDKYRLETATNLQSLHFMDLKRLLNWLKSRITKIKEILNQTVKILSKVKSIQISCKKFLILDNMSIMKSSVQGGNVSWDREVSAMKCPLHRGFEHHFICF